MSLIADSPAVLARFDRVCSLLTARNRGITMRELGAAHALARELQAEAPDPDRVVDFAAALDLDPEELSCP